MNAVKFTIKHEATQVDRVNVDAPSQCDNSWYYLHMKRCHTFWNFMVYVRIYVYAISLLNEARFDGRICDHQFKRQSDEFYTSTGRGGDCTQHCHPAEPQHLECEDCNLLWVESRECHSEIHLYGSAQYNLVLCVWGRHALLQVTVHRLCNDCWSHQEPMYSVNKGAWNSNNQRRYSNCHFEAEMGK